MDAPMVHQLNSPFKYYRHSPLIPSRNDIRLFRVMRSPYSKFEQMLLKLKGNLSYQIVECEIRVFDLEKAPPYTALSYMWGDPGITHTILINVKRFEVRDNLFQFLLAFRDDKANTSWLWTDAICIDQTKNAERNHQVQLMSRIYQGSSMVISWLGRDPELVKAAQQVKVAKPWEPSKKATKKLRLIVSSPYFTRLWIIQELLLAPEVQFLCGTTWFSIDEISRDVILELQLDKTAPRIAMHILAEIHKRSTCRGLSSPYRGQHTLHDCISYYSEAQCENPRDKVYGLLGLVENPFITIDYNKPIHDVFLDAVLAVYKEDARRLREDQFCKLGANMGIPQHHLGVLRPILKKIRWEFEYHDAFTMGFQHAGLSGQAFWWVYCGHLGMTEVRVPLEEDCEFF